MSPLTAQALPLAACSSPSSSPPCSALRTSAGRSSLSTQRKSSRSSRSSSSSLRFPAKTSTRVCPSGRRPESIGGSSSVYGTSIIGGSAGGAGVSGIMRGRNTATDERNIECCGYICGTTVSTASSSTCQSSFPSMPCTKQGNGCPNVHLSPLGKFPLVRVSPFSSTCSSSALRSPSPSSSFFCRRPLLSSCSSPCSLPSSVASLDSSLHDDVTQADLEADIREGGWPSEQEQGSEQAAEGRTLEEGERRSQRAELKGQKVASGGLRKKRRGSPLNVKNQEEGLECDNIERKKQKRDGEEEALEERRCTFEEMEDEMAAKEEEKDEQELSGDKGNMGRWLEAKKRKDEDEAARQIESTDYKRQRWKEEDRHPKQTCEDRRRQQRRERRQKEKDREEKGEQEESEKGETSVAQEEEVEGNEECESSRESTQDGTCGGVWICRNLKEERRKMAEYRWHEGNTQKAHLVEAEDGMYRLVRLQREPDQESTSTFRGMVDTEQVEEEEEEKTAIDEPDNATQDSNNTPENTTDWSDLLPLASSYIHKKQSSSDSPSRPPLPPSRASSSPVSSPPPSVRLLPMIGLAPWKSSVYSDPDQSPSLPSLVAFPQHRPSVVRRVDVYLSDYSEVCALPPDQQLPPYVQRRAAAVHSKRGSGMAVRTRRRSPASPVGGRGVEEVASNDDEENKRSPNVRCYGQNGQPHNVVPASRKYGNKQNGDQQINNEHISGRRSTSDEGNDSSSCGGSAVAVSGCRDVPASGGNKAFCFFANNERPNRLRLFLPAFDLQADVYHVYSAVADEREKRRTDACRWGRGVETARDRRGEVKLKTASRRESDGEISRQLQKPSSNDDRSPNNSKEKTDQVVYPSSVLLCAAAPWGGSPWKTHDRRGVALPCSLVPPPPLTSSVSRRDLSRALAARVGRQWRSELASRVTAALWMMAVAQRLIGSEEQRRPDGGEREQEQTVRGGEAFWETGGSGAGGDKGKKRKRNNGVNPIGSVTPVVLGNRPFERPRRIGVRTASAGTAATAGPRPRSGRPGGRAAVSSPSSPNATKALRDALEQMNREYPEKQFGPLTKSLVDGDWDYRKSDHTDARAGGLQEQYIQHAAGPSKALPIATVYSQEESCYPDYPSISPPPRSPFDEVVKESRCAGFPSASSAWPRLPLLPGGNFISAEEAFRCPFSPVHFQWCGGVPAVDVPTALEPDPPELHAAASSSPSPANLPPSPLPSSNSSLLSVLPAGSETLVSATLSALPLSVVPSSPAPSSLTCPAADSICSGSVAVNSTKRSMDIAEQWMRLSEMCTDELEKAVEHILADWQTFCAKWEEHFDANVPIDTPELYRVYPDTASAFASALNTAGKRLSSYGAGTDDEEPARHGVGGKGKRKKKRPRWLDDDVENGQTKKENNREQLVESDGDNPYCLCQQVHCRG
eukprot:GHVS01097527.1.p1 GENE.GHVS01097527.1~~GHVS01097527.1.p1  ORF type:complete len:1422 (+),score=314.16 GHVS01097527.1:66-4331(+)